MSADISERCDAIEECYEFMLAYAAQGLPSVAGSKSGGQIREYLERAAKAIAGLGRDLRDGGETRMLGASPNDIWHSFRCWLATRTTRLLRLSWFWHNPLSALN